jgi:lipopolysaccharide transport system ATP-binding protein
MAPIALLRGETQRLEAMTMTASAPRSTLIRFDKVSKRFALRTTARQRAGEILFGKAPPHEHWALQEINLSITRGETIGLIGANGAGKSTLLALVAAASTPTMGTVEVFGRVSALLELGAGFHPDWTGRQNAEFQIRLRGHGSKEAAALIKEVEAFADIGLHFDQPLKTCSSGMALRVAFAAAVCVEPDILIVDEALAVGDAAFQHKCFRKLSEFRERGVTILLVTHRLELIPQLCSRAFFLKSGRIMFDGAPSEALKEYARSEFPAPSSPISVSSGEKDDAFGGYRFGEATEIIEAVRTSSGARVVRHVSGEVARFDVDLRFDRDVDRPLFGFSLRSVEDVVLYAVNSNSAGAPLAAARRGERRTVRIDIPLRLSGGTFFADFSICAEDSGIIRVLDAFASHIRLDISGRSDCGGLVDLEARMCAGEVAEGRSWPELRH